MHEIRYAVRTLTKSPGFTAIAVLTLALGIGAATAIVSVVDAVLLRPLPYPEPQRIVKVWEVGAGGNSMNFADPNFDDCRAQNETFAALAQYAWWPSSVSGGSEPVRVSVATVSADFFDVLEVRPSIGRAFVAAEQRLGGAPAAIVSHDYWQRYLGGSTDLSALHVSMDGTSFAVVGVMPARFSFPERVAVWVPREREEKLPSRTAHNWHAIGRIRDGATLAQARANLGAIARRIRDAYGEDVDLVDARVAPLSDALVGHVRPALLTLLGAVALLLLVACANVAGLLLARTSSRRKELAVRTALGAGRGRLARQFLAEAFVLSSAAGALGVLIAVWAVKALPAILPLNLPRREEIAVNMPVLLFAVVLVSAMAVGLGAFAAWRAGARDLQQALAAGSRSFTGSGASQRVRRFLVIGEIAVTLVILIGAGLLARSFVRLVSTSPGFRTDDLITMQFSLPPAEEKAAIAGQVRLMDEVLRRIRALPGVAGVALTGGIPVAAGDNLAEGTFLLLDGQAPPADVEEFGRIARDRSRTGHALYAVASPGYFRTMGIRLVRGRTFGELEDSSAPHVAVISDALARERWPNQDPIGRVLEFGNMDGDLTPLTVVGVVADVRARGLDQPPGAIIYVNYRQRGVAGAPTLLVRNAGDAGAIVSASSAVFRELLPDVPVKVSTFDEAMDGWLGNRRFLLLLVGSFAAAALALAALGIYGAVAFSVARRTQEIGVRMALGAQPGDVLRMVIGDGARMAAVGTAIGAIGSLAITRVMSTLLFGIRPTDPLTFGGVAAVLIAVVLLACYIPARRAMRVSPQAALHYE